MKVSNRASLCTMIDRATAKIFTTLSVIMTEFLKPAIPRIYKLPVVGRLAVGVSNLVCWRTICYGHFTWNDGSATKDEAGEGNFRDNPESVGVNAENVKVKVGFDVLRAAQVKTEQVVTWWMFGFHLNAVTHMALDRLFPSAESEITSAADALMYVGGAWGKAAIYAAIMSAILLINHESGHYAAGVKGGNLRHAIMEPIFEQKKKPLSQRLVWTIRNYAGRVLIPFGKFSGIARPNALDYELDGAAPLPVRAAGPRRDLYLAIPTLLISLSALGFLADNVGDSSIIIEAARRLSEWLFPAGVAALYGSLRYDNGALMENARVKREERRIIAQGRQGQEEKVLAFDTEQIKRSHQAGEYGG